MKFGPSLLRRFAVLSVSSLMALGFSEVQSYFVSVLLCVVLCAVQRRITAAFAT